jgi:hypothetical protein
VTGGLLAGEQEQAGRVGQAGPGEVPGLVMPEGYKRSIAAWFARLNGHASL